MPRTKRPPRVFTAASIESIRESSAMPVQPIRGRCEELKRCPFGRFARGLVWVKTARLVSARGGARNLSVPVDDPRSVEVIRGQLAAHTIAGQDANPKAAHLARHVAEHHMIVVLRDAKHRVREGLNDLA